MCFKTGIQITSEKEDTENDKKNFRKREYQVYHWSSQCLGEKKTKEKFYVFTSFIVGRDIRMANFERTAEHLNGNGNMNIPKK